MRDRVRCVGTRRAGRSRRSRLFGVFPRRPFLVLPARRTLRRSHGEERESENRELKERHNEYLSES